MINPNQRIGQPFGDIYTPNTSHTDRLSQQFYVEEKQREAQEKQMQDALDNEFSKNLTGIRDIDTDDLTKAYGEFKLANKAAMRQRDGVSPKQQMELLRKKAAMYDIINKSKTQKALEDDVLGGLKKDRYAYQKDAHQILMQSRATPLSKLGGLYGYDYSNKGTNTDFQPIHKNAEGNLNAVYSTKKPIGTDGFEEEVTEWKFGNTPKKYYDVLLQGLHTAKAQWDAESMISQTPKEIIHKTQEDFLNLPVERWQQMGLNSPQDLTINPTDSLVEKYAKHNAQLYTLQAKPVMGKVDRVENKEAKFRAQYAKEKDLIKLRGALQVANAKQLIDYKKDVDESGDEKTQELWADRFLDSEEENYSAPNIVDKFLGKGTKVNLNPVLYKALGEPNEVEYMGKGQYYLTYLGENDKKEIVKDENRSGIIDRSGIKLALGVKSMSKKELPKEMNNRTSKKEEVNQKSKPVSLNAKDWGKQ